MIRTMQSSDAAEVCDLLVGAMGYTCTEEVVQRQIRALCDDSHYLLMVYVENGEICGFIQAQRYDTLRDAGGWNIIALGVKPERQGAGIGRALLRAVETEVAGRGGRFVRLNSRVQRESAHGFYEHLGYTCDKVQKRFSKRL